MTIRRRAVMRRVSTTGLVVLVLLLASIPVAAGPAGAPPFCAPGQVPQLTFGLATLRVAVGDAMGAPIECPRTDPATGNLVQWTSTGLAAYDAATNTPSFTEGHAHWALAPTGLRTWSGGGVAGPLPTIGPPPTSEPREPRATFRSSGWAPVLGVMTPHTFVVEIADGQHMGVAHIGVRGFPAATPEEAAPATAFHAEQIPVGSWVWLEWQPELGSPYSFWVLRHVYRPDVSPEPVGARLLRAGFARTYLDSLHRYTRAYADLQAAAIRGAVGQWADIPYNALFVPRGQERGGLPVDPRLLPALRELDADPLGNARLRTLAWVPLPVAVVEPRDPAAEYVARFSSLMGSIEIIPSAATAGPDAIAAVLFHEAFHAKQALERALTGFPRDCVGDEREAYTEAAEFWLARYGPGGKPDVGHWLDAEVNAVARSYVDGQLDQAARLACGYLPLWRPGPVPAR